MENRFALSRVTGMPVSDEDLLTDLRNVADSLSQTSVTMHQYREVGRYDDTVVSRRFGSWNKGLRAAGLEISNRVNIPDEELFENILKLWQHLGRQPRRSELAHPPSKISQGPYNRRFGSWTNALTRFVEYANSTEMLSVELTKPEANSKPRTPRDPSLRLRFKVFQRDRFTCRQCGQSPATVSEVRLHIDHIKPWSKGGETALDNLQTLCEHCNLGKSDLT